MRPVLKRGLLPVWRDRDTLQIGVDSRRAVALSGMAGVASVIGLLDGSRDRAQVIETAADQGIPAKTTERVLALLAAAGALDDFPAGTLRLLPPPLRGRLAAELAAASLAHRDGDGGARTLARRLTAQVRIHGAGAVGAGIAALLRRSGIGQVTEAEPGTSRPGAALAATGGAGNARGGTALPDLAVLVGRPRMDLRDTLMRDHIPHLAVAADEAIGVVGPLVIPGRTACLRCLDLARTDRDPAWPLILAQLAGREPDPLACDAPLAAAVAAHAAAQALAFIDRPADMGAAANGTLELVLPSWQWRRRTWPPHRDCDCGGPVAPGKTAKRI
jgi:bacteriocin biosynthesis cyclodehydratase domain-containing protein